MLTDIVTVIVPAFNAEATLQRCLDSLLAQAHRQVDVVVVDDGSIDGTRPVADAYARADSRVRVLTQSNQGLSEARNAGIRVAKGGWVTFLDADDWVEREYLSAPLACAARNDAQVVIFGHFVDFEGPNGETVRSVERLPWSAERTVDGFPAAWVDQSFVGAVGYAWNKLYRVVPGGQDFFFERGLRQVEDIEFQSRVMPGAESVVLCPRSLIHYVQPFTGYSLGRLYSADLLDLRLRGLSCAHKLIHRWGLDLPDHASLWAGMAVSSAWAITLRAWRSAKDLRVRFGRVVHVLRRAEVLEISRRGFSVRGLTAKDRSRAAFLAGGHLAAVRLVRDAKSLAVSEKEAGSP